MRNFILFFFLIVSSTFSLNAQQLLTDTINSSNLQPVFKTINGEEPLKLVKKVKTYDTHLLRSIDFRIGYARLNKKVLVAESYDLVSYRSKITQLDGNKFMMGIVVNHDRLFIPIDIGIAQWGLKVDANVHKSYFFKSNYEDDGGIRTQYDDYQVNYESTHYRVVFSTGIGIKLFRPERFFNLIPMIRLNGSSYLSNKVSTNNLKEHHYYSGTDLPGGFPDFLHESITNKPATDSILSTSLYKSNFNCSFSAVFRFKITSKWLIDIELGYAFDNQSFLNVGKTGSLYTLTPSVVTDKGGKIGSFSMCYSIPLKNAKRNILKSELQ